MIIHLIAGTDTYGRVKSVSGTPIVTKFAMLQGLPIYPIRSYYLVKANSIARAGVPFVIGTQEVTVGGIPLARIDPTSIIMAYLRGAFGLLAVVGCIALVPGIMILTGEPLDEGARLALRGLLVALGVGVAGGVLTYSIPTVSRRERAIRRYCGEFLGAAIDPARVSTEVIDIIDEWVNDSSLIPKDLRIRSIHQLVMARLDLTDSPNAESAEHLTDEWLERLGGDGSGDSIVAGET